MRLYNKYYLCIGVVLLGVGIYFGFINSKLQLNKILNTALLVSMISGFTLVMRSFYKPKEQDSLPPRG